VDSSSVTSGYNKFNRLFRFFTLQRLRVMVLLPIISVAVKRCFTLRSATIKAQYPNNFLFYIERSINKSSNSALVLGWSACHAKGGNAADTTSAAD
jgi:hypothetical protein